MQRVNWIDSAKGLAILFIVLGHFSDIGRDWSYTFHIPIFFILGGALFKPNSDLSLSKFVKNKFKSLMFPFYKYSLILLPYWLVFERFYRPSGSLIEWQYSFLGLLFGNGNREFWLSYGGSIWFLPVYFCTVLLFYLITKYTKNSFKQIVILFSVIIVGYYFAKIFSFNLPFGLNIAFVSVFWFGIGYFLCNWNVFENIAKQNLFSKIYLGIIMICLSFMSSINLDLYSLTIGDDIIKLMFNPLLGSFFIIILGMFLLNSKLIQLLGRSSLAIMVMHQPVGRILFYFTSQIFNIPVIELKNSYLSMILSALLVGSILLLGYLEMILHKKIKLKLYKFNLFY